jgi:hypothetical protein
MAAAQTITCRWFCFYVCCAGLEALARQKRAERGEPEGMHAALVCSIANTTVCAQQQLLAQHTVRATAAGASISSVLRQLVALASTNNSRSTAAVHE